MLANFGYVEEEFLYEGTANTYTAPGPDGSVDVADRGIPYRTRLIVRRPMRQSRFNGVVIVEWFNVTNQYDTDVLWLYQKEFLVREGYAWVGVSAQNTGLSAARTGLKAWSPKRYGTLDVTNDGKVTGDALAADIYSQAGVAVRHVPEVLGGLKPVYVIAAGQSQSAMRLGPYLNGPHQRAPVYDAALLTVNNGAIRPDIAIPVIKVLSETERDSARRQPDQDKVRVWPVTGATHSEQYSLLSRAAFLERDLASAGGGRVRDTCALARRNPLRVQRGNRRAGEMAEDGRRAAPRADVHVRRNGRHSSDARGAGRRQRGNARARRVAARAASLRQAAGAAGRPRSR